VVLGAGSMADTLTNELRVEKGAEFLVHENEPGELSNSDGGVLTLHLPLKNQQEDRR